MLPNNFMKDWMDSQEVIHSLDFFTALYFCASSVFLAVCFLCLFQAAVSFSLLRAPPFHPSLHLSTPALPP